MVPKYCRLLLLLVVALLATTRLYVVAAGNECKVGRCSNFLGVPIIIRFPFHLKQNVVDNEHLYEPRDYDDGEECGYPGFELSCVHDSTVLELNNYVVKTSISGLHLSISLNASVTSIDYGSRKIFFDLEALQPPKLQLLYSNSSSFPQASSSPFRFTESYHGEGLYTFFNCSSFNPHVGDVEITNVSGHKLNVSVVNSDEEPPLYCTKMFDVSAALGGDALTWSTPNCDKCEANGEYCRLNKNKFKKKNDRIDVNITTNYSRIDCFPISGGNASDKLLLPGEFGGLFLLSLLYVAIYYVIKKNKQKKKDQLKIEMFLEDYRALKPTRYSYFDIKKITNQFKEKLGQGGFGSVFKGQLSNDVIVAVKVLNDDSKGNGEDFMNEVGTIGQIHHVNVVRLVGYCADGSRRALVYEFLPNDSLEKFVYSGKNHNKFLGWQKMQQIALGIAKGIEYLHQGCSQRILHFDIKPHNILLDKNFNPKISDFGLAKLCSKTRSIVSMTMARGTIGYIAPEVFSRNFGEVSSKSDVYSFGMLLLDMVGAKNNPVGSQNTSNAYFPEWIFHQLEQGGEVTVEIEEEVDNKIARKLTIVGLWCVAWHPIDRPSMKHVIQMLEGEDSPPIPPNPFSSTSSGNATPATNARPFSNELEVISESE